MRDLGGHGSGRRPPAPGADRSGPPGRNGHGRPAWAGRPFDTTAVDAAGDEEGPVDLVSLQADDELINALSSGLGVSGPGPQHYDADDHLIAMLAAWRADVDAEPIPPLVEPDVAAGLLAPPARRSRRVGYLRPVVAAVAVAACGLGVLSVSAHEAQPGDTLWGLSKVLYSERAEKVQAASDLRTGIERVHAKLADGDTAGAEQEVQAMGPLLAKVDPGQDQAYFDQQREFLAAKIAETPPGTPTDPSAPLRDGRRAPQPPSTEGGADPRTTPGSGTSPVVTSPGTGTSAGTAPGSSAPGTLPGPQGPAPGPVATQPAPVTPTTSPVPPPSPTTEGSPDPTTTSRPTASGPDTPDSGSTTAGGVSSTPR